MKLTYKMKMQAIEDKYYSDVKWEPKVGDYYCICRNDLQLFKIVSENGSDFVIACIDESGKELYRDDFYRINFLNDFGERRVHISDYIFKAYGRS